LKVLHWVIGVPVAVIFAGAVAFFVARETEPPPPEVPLNERLEAECKRMFPDDGDLAEALNDCKTSCSPAACPKLTGP
jgi:hypothetical protein